MGRAAGDSPRYTFTLYDASKGRYSKDVKIELPSVTTIIGRILAKPTLTGWHYRQTRDIISGLVTTLDAAGVDHGDIVDCLADADWLEEYLKDNRLRPQDTTADAAERGTEMHQFLESLSRAYLLGDEETAQKVAQGMLTSDNGWEHGIAAWWIDTAPRVVAAEKMLYSLRYRYAGTVDLVWADSNDLIVVTDLKTREEGRGVYESDKIQTRAYKVAWEEMGNEPVSRTTVLVVREDGSYIEEESEVADDVFLNLVSVYQELVLED